MKKYILLALLVLLWLIIGYQVFTTETERAQTMLIGLWTVITIFTGLVLSLIKHKTI